MRKWFLIFLIASFAIISTGCVTYIAFWNRPRHTPAYCYDCHSHPSWVRFYTSCGMYVIKAGDDGYYYKPRNIRKAKFKHRTYDSRVVKERQQKHVEDVRKYKSNKKTGHKEDKKSRSSKKKP